MSNGTAPSILGLLTWWPMTGYEIKSAIEDSVGNFWSESFGQIYPELRRLQEAGLVQSEAEGGENTRSKRRYAITDAGREELRRWLAETPHERPLRNELLLKIFFGLRSSPRELISHVETARDGYAKRLSHIRAKKERITVAQAKNPHLPFWLITMRNGIAQYEALLTWCDQTIEDLERIEASPETAQSQ